MGKVFVEERKNRCKNIVKRIMTVLALGILYYFWILITDLKIPCVFYVVTKKYCPGCGITRMFLALLKLDFATAMRCNLLVFCLLGPGFVWGIVKSFFYIKDGEVQTSVFEKICIVIVFICTIAFWILRNTSYGVCLQPIL